MQTYTGRMISENEGRSGDRSMSQGVAMIISKFQEARENQRNTLLLLSPEASRPSKYDLGLAAPEKRNSFLLFKPSKP